MKNETKISIKVTNVKVALIYNNNTTTILDDTLIGKYTLKQANKYIKSGEHSSDYIENVKNCEVLSVEYSTEYFECDTELLYHNLIMLDCVKHIK